MTKTSSFQATSLLRPRFLPQQLYLPRTSGWISRMSSSGTSLLWSHMRPSQPSKRCLAAGIRARTLPNQPNCLMQQIRLHLGQIQARWLQQRALSPLPSSPIWVLLPQISVFQVFLSPLPTHSKQLSPRSRRTSPISGQEGQRRRQPSRQGRCPSGFHPLCGPQNHLSMFRLTLRPCRQWSRRIWPRRSGWEEARSQDLRPLRQVQPALWRARPRLSSIWRAGYLRLKSSPGPASSWSWGTCYTESSFECTAGPSRGACSWGWLVLIFKSISKSFYSYFYGFAL